MNIFVYSDESGVMDKVHNKYFVFGGLVFLSKDEKDSATRRYIAAEKNIRKAGGYDRGIEVKASTINAGEKRKLYRLLKDYYKFGIIIEQEFVLDSIMGNKKSKQRYLDFAYKIGVKRLLQALIAEHIIKPEEVKNIYFSVDEHTTATNGVYELRETLEEEFKNGIHNWNFSTFYPPIFPNMDSVQLNYCNSEAVTLVRAADIVANRIYHDVLSGTPFVPFNAEENKLLVTYLPRENIH
ncbi:MAG: DUF3800 domain-containing protein [Oscillospiraceae bacterium]|nr:DUF3800 domain-containing protein [Oscillospiraceae bacterium]MBR2422042.1 DUF3800 domain-containing protein [Oscillospiraceae bacterium]